MAAMSVLKRMLGVQMEEKYGCPRMVMLWLISSLGGQLLCISGVARFIVACPERVKNVNWTSPGGAGI
jgi:hypothetical protein